MSQDLSSLFNEDDDDFFKSVGPQVVEQPAVVEKVAAVEQPAPISSFSPPPQAKVTDSSQIESLFGVSPKQQNSNDDWLKIETSATKPQTVETVAPTSPKKVTFTSPQISVMPVNAPSPPPPAAMSLIAARRAASAAAAEPVLIQPEQDVIYKTYNPTGFVAPPPGGPPQITGPPAMASPPLITTPPLPVAQPQMSVPIHPPRVAPSLVSPVRVGPPQMTGPPSISPLPVGPPQMTVQSSFSPPRGLAGPSFPSPIPSVPSAPSAPSAPPSYQQPPPIAPAARRPEGLQARVSIGFGGRIVMCGGKFGMKVYMTSISDALAQDFESRKFLNIMRSAPTPLGSATQLCTEQLVSWIDSLMTTTNATNRFTYIPEQELLLMFLRDRLTLQSSSGGRRGGINRNQSLLTRIATDCQLLNHQQSVLSQFVNHIVRGEMKEMIEMGKNHPQFLPFAMAIASIHSAEFFRESVLAFATQTTVSSSSPNPSHLIDPSVASSDETLLSVLKQVVVIFASTVGAHRLDITPFTISNWKLFLCLIGSLTKPGGDSQGGLFLLRLGDELIRSNQIAAGQLCILVSGKKDNVLDSVDSHDGLIALLGVDHRSSRQFDRLTDPLAILLSEIYEYTWRMSPGSSDIAMGLQPFKFAYANLLAADLGMFETAEKYLEIINAFIRAAPTNKYSVRFRTCMRELDERIAGTRPNSSGRPGGSESSNVVGIADVGHAALGAIWGGITAVARTSRMI